MRNSPINNINFQLLLSINNFRITFLYLFLFTYVDFSAFVFGFYLAQMKEAKRRKLKRSILEFYLCGLFHCTVATVLTATCVGETGQKIRRFHGRSFIVVGCCKRTFESPPRIPSHSLAFPIAKIHRSLPMKLPSIVTTGRLLSSTHRVCVPGPPQRSISRESTFCPPSHFIPDL